MAAKTIQKQDFTGRDIVSIDDLSLDEINYVLGLAEKIKKGPEKFKTSRMGRVMAPLFFENSTRTSGSFQMAMLKMGGSVLDFDVSTSSIQKGETLRDTLKTIEGYHPDILVIRHKRDGAARFAADVLEVPVINAGDGKNQHPTQTLLDLYTIKEIRGDVNGAKIAMAGDLKYGRTVHSLALALSQYEDCEMSFISPDSLRMPRELLTKLEKRGVSFSEHGLDKLEDLAGGPEILYITRVQRERFPEGPEGDHEYQKVCREYCLREHMLEHVDNDFRVLHPLPKVREIEDAIDGTKYAYYFQQAENGLYVRMALIDLLTK